MNQSIYTHSEHCEVNSQCALVDFTKPFDSSVDSSDHVTWSHIAWPLACFRLRWWFPCWICLPALITKLTCGCIPSPSCDVTAGFAVVLLTGWGTEHNTQQVCYDDTVELKQMPGVPILHFHYFPLLTEFGVRELCQESVTSVPEGIFFTAALR